MEKNKLQDDFNLAKQAEAEAQKALQSATTDEARSKAEADLEAATWSRMDAEKKLAAKDDKASEAIARKSTGKKRPATKGNSDKDKDKDKDNDNDNDNDGDGDKTVETRLVVISSQNPRRRAGMEFGPEPRTVDLSTLSQEQIAAIENDPLLNVRAHE